MIGEMFGAKHMRAHVDVAGMRMATVFAGDVVNGEPSCVVTYHNECTPQLAELAFILAASLSTSSDSRHDRLAVLIDELMFVIGEFETRKATDGDSSDGVEEPPF